MCPPDPLPAQSNLTDRIKSRVEELRAAEAERDRYREALEAIAEKTFETQYDEPVGAVVRFASQIHHMARSAIEPPAPDQQQRVPERSSEEGE